MDADNGFWLCANHDKMFEYGIITFDENTGILKMDLKNLDELQRNYIKTITNKKNINPEHFTDDLKKYLSIHNNRLKKTISNYNYQNVE